MNLLTKKDSRAVAQEAPRRTLVPRYDVRETAEAFILTAELPGVERSALETTIDGESLTIFGRRDWKAPAESTPIHRETPDADFRLVLDLYHRDNRDAVRAVLSQGVLTLTVPKAEAVKLRRIEIQG